mgnify:FL=1
MVRAPVLRVQCDGRAGGAQVKFLDTEVRVDIPVSVRTQGRAGLCSTEIIAKVAELVREGATDSYAAQAVGITRTTFYRWMNRGAEGIEPYASFRRAVDEAHSEACVSAEIAVRKYNPLAYLTRGPARRDPERWAAEQAPAVQVNISNNKVEYLDALDTDELRTLERITTKIIPATLAPSSKPMPEEPE